MNKPHKHAECIIAWANGYEIEYYESGSGRWYLTSEPTWNKHGQYRIKPQPVIKKMYMHYDGIEEVVAENFWHTKDVPQQMYFNNNNMSNHLEFTFTDDKLTSVEIKKT